MHKYFVKESPQWATAVMKGELFSALAALAKGLPTFKKSYCRGDGVPWQLQLKPQRKLVTTADITETKPLLLFPFTTDVGFVPKRLDPFAATSIEITTNGEISVLTLQHTFLDPLLATD